MITKYFSKKWVIRIKLKFSLKYVKQFSYVCFYFQHKTVVKYLIKLFRLNKTFIFVLFHNWFVTVTQYFLIFTQYFYKSKYYWYFCQQSLVKLLLVTVCLSNNLWGKYCLLFIGKALNNNNIPPIKIIKKYSLPSLFLS